MKEPFHAVEKTAELLDRLVKDQYEAGEVEVAHDLSKLRGMMLPFSMTDRHVTEAWLRNLEDKKRREANGWPQRDVIVQGGKNAFEKAAKELAKVSDEELEKFMTDKFNTTDTTDFVATSIKPLTKDQLERGIDFLEKKRKEKVDYVPRELDELPVHKEDNWTIDASKLPGGNYSAPSIYGMPNIKPLPLIDPQHLTEQCLKCRGLGMRKYSDKVMKMCDRCQGTGRA